MKSKAILITGLLATLANSTPLVYTFSGNVPETGTGVIDDRAMNGSSGLYWSNNISYGESFEYKLLIDFDRPGEVVQADGSITPNEKTGDPAYTFFYADYISGDLFSDLYNGRYDSVSINSPPSHKTIDRFGVNLLAELRSLAFVNPSHWTSIHIFSSGEFATDWKIGDTFLLQEVIQDPRFIELSASLNTNVVLTDISPMSVPEPNQLITFALGLIFATLMFGKRRISDNKEQRKTLRSDHRSN
jgi:hypothetical protein